MVCGFCDIGMRRRMRDRGHTSDIFRYLSRGWRRNTAVGASGRRKFHIDMRIERQKYKGCEGGEQGWKSL